MKTFRDFIDIILVVIILGIVIWYVFFKKPIPIPSQVEYIYVTDTIYKSVPYKVLVPYEVYTPPQYLIRYQIDSSRIDSLKLVLNNDSLIIEGLKSQIIIHQNYIKQFPENPKLLNLNLFRDSLSLATLPISGIIQEEKWPLDLNLYSYNWDLSTGFTRKNNTSLSPTEEGSKIQYYVGGGVDLLWLSPYLSGRIEKEWARVRIYGNANVGLLRKESSKIEIGGEYKLNAKDRK